MKTYEKILIGLVLLLLVLELIPGFPLKILPFSLVTLLLALSYIFGGYYLFDIESKKDNYIPILSGIAIGSSLLALPFLIRLNGSPIFKILPLINMVLFIVLGIYLLMKWYLKKVAYLETSIFIRSAIVLVSVGFFWLHPISFKPVRVVLSALNQENISLQDNLEMLGHIQEFKSANKKGDCDQAIESANKALIAGKRWLNIIPENKRNIQDNHENDLRIEFDSTDQNISNIQAIQNEKIKSDLKRIGGVFEYLYLAYKCRADNYYNNGQIDLALKYYLKGDRALNGYDYNISEWYIEQAFSLNKIALCYLQLNKYNLADSLFLEALEKYTKLNLPPDKNMALFYSNLAKSFSEQLYYSYSNVYYFNSLSILENEPNSEYIKKEIINTYHKVILNYIKLDSTETAKYFIEKVFNLVDIETVEFCHTNLIYGLYLFKLCKYQEAKKVFLECLTCNQNILEPTDQYIAECHMLLAHVKILLAEFDSIQNHLDTGLEITNKNFGYKSTRYANNLQIEAYFKRIVGDYKASEKLYYQILGILNEDDLGNNLSLPLVLSGLADVEILLSKFESAKDHSDSARSIANSLFLLNQPSTTELLNNFAYVNYHVGLYELAESMYEESLKINNSYGQQTATQTAIALNGLGLVMYSKGLLKKSDSLFSLSLELHKELFTENHPFTAIVYLNLASLKLKESKFDQSLEYLTKSLDINNNFFESDHDIFADIYVVFGQLAQRKNQLAEAKKYYQDAYQIYYNKFDEYHIKVKSVQQKL